jgi:hypothetical protein
MGLRVERGRNLGHLEVLKPILLKWQGLVEDFIDGGSDCPWWYNERASLSLFAGAVWLSDGWAFEEFSTKKWARRMGKKGRKRIGRCDIQFGIGKNTFVAEAKQAWPTIGRSDQSGMVTVRAYLQKARDESSRLPNNEGKKLGILFVVPLIRRSKRKQVDKILRRKQIDKILSSFLEQLRKQENRTMAWVFPKKTRTMSYRGNNYYYPGIVLLIQRSRRKQR